jgi:hypothetical protein
MGYYGSILLLALFYTVHALELSNIALPKDVNGHDVITGEAGVLTHGGTFFFYFNDWGTCSGRNCCDTKGGCWSCCMRGGGNDTDCVDSTNHSIVAYESADLVNFKPLGRVFTPNTSSFGGVLYRPHVIYNPATNKYVMWYKIATLQAKTMDHWYGVAVSDSTAGPFDVLVEKVPDLWTGDGSVVSDHFLFQDKDGSAYLVRYHAVQKLNAAFTGVEANQHALLPRPASWEAPIMFKRGKKYFVIGGVNCCACKGGSNAFVFTSDSPLGNWTYAGAINRLHY